MVTREGLREGKMEGRGSVGASPEDSMGSDLHIIFVFFHILAYTRIPSIKRNMSLAAFCCFFVDIFDFLF